MFSRQAGRLPEEFLLSQDVPLHWNKVDSLDSSPLVVRCLAEGSPQAWVLCCDRAYPLSMQENSTLGTQAWETTHREGRVIA